MNINIVVRIRNVEYRRESRQPHGVAPTLKKAMGQALIRTGIAQDRFRGNDGLGLPAINK